MFYNELCFAANVPEVAEAEVQAKEWEHTVLQENLDKELKELDKKLEQKEVRPFNKFLLNCRQSSKFNDFLVCF